MQRATKCKIRIKYNENLRSNKHKDSRKTTFVQQEPTYRRTKVKVRERERERTNGKQWSSFETKACTTGTPLKLELDTKAQDCK
jgi:hypothetical protein